jgi:hypothetical protein
MKYQYEFCFLKLFEQLNNMKSIFFSEFICNDFEYDSVLKKIDEIYIKLNNLKNFLSKMK